MKIKLKDLTSSQWDDWKYNQCPETDCRDCYFRGLDCGCSNYTNSWFNHKDVISDSLLNKELTIPSISIVIHPKNIEWDILHGMMLPYFSNKKVDSKDLSNFFLRKMQSLDEYFRINLYLSFGPDRRNSHILGYLSSIDGYSLFTNLKFETLYRIKYSDCEPRFTLTEIDKEKESM